MARITDLFWTIVTVNTFTYMTTLCFVAAICWFLSEIMKRPGLALWFAPILFLGGLMANFVLSAASLLPTNDKDANVAFAAAAGVLSTLLLLLMAVSLVVAVSERRARKIEGRTIGLPTASGNGR